MNIFEYDNRKGLKQMDYDTYLKKCEDIKKTNHSLLDLFYNYLRKAGLAEKTISRHLSNVDFYINEYLLRMDALSMESGITMIDDFLGNFFIRKCMWSTPANIKTTATSIKKFYKSMVEHEKIARQDYDLLCAIIKDSLDIWQEDCAIYNDPDSPNPFFMF